MFMGFFTTIKENSAKVQTSLSTLIKLILIFSIINAVYFHLWHILFANIFLLFLMFLPYLMKKSVQIFLPREFELIVLIFVVLSFFMGEIRGFIIQAFFGLAVGLIGFALMLILYSNSKMKTNYPLIILFAFSFSMAFGAGLELIKYHMKSLMGYEFGILDYTYTMQGLSWVAVGAFISSIMGYIYMKERKIVRLKVVKKLVKKFKKTNPNFFIKRTDSPEDLLESIKNGEDDKLEFKSTLRTNLYTNEIDKKIEHSVLKTIAAFLNSEGGRLLIGVSDDGEILGIEKDRFENNDKFNLHFTNILKQQIGNEYLPFLDFKLILIENKNILKVECLKSERPVFLKTSEGEKFYIRVGPASVKITGSKIIEYIKNNFKR